MGREASSSSASSSSSSDSFDRRRRKRKSHRRIRGGSDVDVGDGDKRRSSRKEDESRRRRRRRRREEREERRRSKGRSDRRDDSRRKKRRRRRRDVEDDDSGSSSSSSSLDDSKMESSDAEGILRAILRQFPDAAEDLKQLLQMIDTGEGVDVGGISDESFKKMIKKLFFSLKLKRMDNGFFLLAPESTPTLQIVGSLFNFHKKAKDGDDPNSGSPDGQQSLPFDREAHGKEATNPGRRRLIGPEMPSRELLDAAAELMEAENVLREADLEPEDDLLIGPPPPAMVAEVGSANDAERIEEVTRILDADADKPYDILGVNWKMSSDNVKKRYWKLSLMVHPDKCPHPQAHEAFVILNQAFKDLQDPDKRKALDEKIKLKEQEDEMKVELQALREAAQWRKLQGISLEGDDELLAIPKEAPKRDEWMTTLPPERKPGMTMQSTSFSKTTKEGRGDTSIWTDSPLDKAQKAKQNYLEAYNKTKALGEADNERRGMKKDAELVDKYNSSKRSVSLLQKHQEESSRPKKKSKQPEKEEWEGSHPWKPWDREKDLSAGRKNVNLDANGMAQGLATRFSSGAVQRNFL